MDAADAEYYLRRCGEDSLQQRHNSDDLHQRARVLAALDVVAPSAAAAILDEYERAWTLRAVADDRWRTEHDIAEEWTPLMIRSCAQTLDAALGTITLRYVSIGPHESALAVTVRQKPVASSKGRRRRANFDEPPDLDIADDQGNALSSRFDGHGSGGEWVGSYVVSPSLDPAAEFITVLGQRVDLGPGPDDLAVRVEPVDPLRPVSERAARYLRRCLAAPSKDRFESPVPVVIDTLLGLGILTADADVIVAMTDAQDVADRAAPGLSPHPTQVRGSSRGRSRLADRTLGVSVSLPGGVHVAVTDLTVTSDGVSVGFRAAVTSAESLVWSLFDCFALTVTDDASIEHSGQLEGWGGGGGSFEGRMGFPAPSATASTLTLRILTDRADAHVEIPLQRDGAR